MPVLDGQRNPMDTSQVPGDALAIVSGDITVDTKDMDRVDILDMVLASENIAEDLDDTLLAQISDRVFKDYEIDRQSRSVWEKIYGESMELARQLYEKKTWGGEEVANIKYPILGTAAIQYSARAYGNLVKGENYVNVRIYGRDADGKKAARAERVADHMNYQLAIEMPDWEEEMDQLLIYLPIVGCAFKKTYRDFSKNMNVSAFVSAEDLVVNYWAKNLESASRITHIVEMSQNEVIEMIRDNMFSDIESDLKQSSRGRTADTKINNQGSPETESYADEDAPIVFYEQHRWWDLDDDGYKEPYIVTVHKDSQKVVRMTARWTQDSVIRNEAEKIVRIDPVHHFTQYSFFPAFDGNFYRMGFGILLSPINKTVNTIISQLLDAGTLANRQIGFVNQGIRLTKAGATGYLRFKPGEWKIVQTPGDDIRKNILPLPIKEPSDTLFQLLGLMLEASKELASQSEVLSGEQTQPNVPATTTLALIEQGLKVFSSVYKRTYRGQKSEYKKIRRLNYLYTDNEVYNSLLDVEEYVSAKLDYNDKDMDICPISGTADVSDVQKLIKSQALMELRGQGLDDKKILKTHLEALQIGDVEDFFPQEEQPNYQLMIMEKQLAQKDAAIQQKERELDLKEREVFIKDAQAYEQMIRTRTEAIKNLAVAEGMEAGQQLDIYKAEVENFGKAVDTFRQVLEFRMKQNESQQGAIPSMATGANVPGSVQGAGQPAPTAR